MAGGTETTRDELGRWPGADPAASTEETVGDCLRRGLDWLARLVRFDLATVFELREGELDLRVARGSAGRQPCGATGPAAWTTSPPSAQALETRRARAFTEDDHAHGDGDPFDGVLDLPAGHSCMVVPLARGSGCSGC